MEWPSTWDGPAVGCSQQWDGEDVGRVLHEPSCYVVASPCRAVPLPSPAIGRPSCSITQLEMAQLVRRCMVQANSIDAFGATLSELFLFR